MQSLIVMMPIKKIRWNKVIKSALRALPEIPYVNEKPKASVLPYVFGAIGFAVVGGVAAVMFFSPKTRERALGAAKDGIDYAKDTISHMPIAEKLGVGETKEVRNGLHRTAETYSSTGL